MALRDFMRPGNIIHRRDLGRSESQKLEGAKSEVRILGQTQSFSPFKISHIVDIAF
jgi:hypothetical protein